MDRLLDFISELDENQISLWGIFSVMIVVLPFFFVYSMVTHVNYDCSSVKHKEKMEYLASCSEHSSTAVCASNLKELYCKIK